MRVTRRVYDIQGHVSKSICMLATFIYIDAYLYCIRRLEMEKKTAIFWSRIWSKLIVIFSSLNVQNIAQYVDYSQVSSKVVKGDFSHLLKICRFSCCVWWTIPVSCTYTRVHQYRCSRTHRIPLGMSSTVSSGIIL